MAASVGQNAPPFYAHFFTETEFSLLKALPKELRESLELGLSLRNTQAIQIVLTIKKCCELDLKKEADAFFQVLLTKGTDTPEIREVVHVFSKEGLAKAFFHLFPVNRDYQLALSHIHEACTLLQEIAEKPNSREVLENLSPWEAGGKGEIEAFLVPLAIHLPVSELIPQHLDQILSLTAGYEVFKSKILHFLGGKNEQQRSPISFYLTLFRMVEKLNFPPALKMEWLRWIIGLTTQQDRENIHLDDLSLFLQWAQSVAELWGEDLLYYFCPKPGAPLPSHHEITSCFRLMMHFTPDREEVIVLLKSSQNSDEIYKNLQNLFVKIPVHEIHAAEDLDLAFKRFEKDPKVRFPLQGLSNIRQQYETVRTHCENWSSKSLEELLHLSDQLVPSRKNTPQLAEDQLLKIMAIGRLALRQSFGVYLYHTQVIAILGLLSGTGKGIIGQKLTGEGKSFAFTLLLFILSFSEGTVDLITSDPGLVEREVRKTKDFFCTFRLVISSLIDHHPEPNVL